MKKLLTFCGILAVVGALGIGIYSIQAADHIDAPAVTGDGTGIPSDITDLYAFQSPSSSENRVFVVNTNGLLSPDATANATFPEDMMIEINIDNTGDTVEELVIQAIFVDGEVIVYGPVAPNETSSLTSTISFNGTVTRTDITELGEEPNVGTNSGISVFAGPRRDPFFFDFDQFNAVIAGEASSFLPPDEATDEFDDTNVMALVVEVPNDMLGTADVLNVWATTNIRSN